MAHVFETNNQSMRRLCAECKTYDELLGRYSWDPPRLIEEAKQLVISRETVTRVGKALLDRAFGDVIERAAAELFIKEEIHDKGLTISFDGEGAAVSGMIIEPAVVSINGGEWRQFEQSINSIAQGIAHSTNDNKTSCYDYDEWGNVSSSPSEPAKPEVNLATLTAALLKIASRRYDSCQQHAAAILKALGFPEDK